VVNNGISDDCNHTQINANQVYLRIAGLGSHVYAFHYSTDGQFWHLVRYFYLNTNKDALVGFSSQSPTGKSCQTTFTSISYAVTKLQDIRGGK
jgi:regulation of enolase protein 1 (concanavalin A-like superfamily)